jgi:hypothetical protein
LIPDQFVPDTDVKAELGGISTMTLWRWDKDPKMIALGLPPAIRIGQRKYRSRKLLEKFKTSMLRRAIAARGGEAA